MENFNNRVNEAAAKYLDRRGYDILEEPWKDGKAISRWTSSHSMRSTMS